MDKKKKIIVFGLLGLALLLLILYFLMGGTKEYKITFDKLIVYKIKEEAQLFGNCRHFFKLKLEEPIGMVKVLQDFSTRNITEYARRNSAGKIEEI